MDQAAEYLAQATQRYPPLSPIDDKRLIRKIDWALVPMVCACPWSHFATPLIFILKAEAI